MIDKEEMAKKVWASFPDVKEGRCLYNAIAGSRLLQSEGVRCQIHAGSMSWPFIDLANDDGVSPTHFSFMWSPSDMPSIIATIEGRMPEMHVWLVLPDSGEIVDFTTHELPNRAKVTAGLDWQGPLPPKFFWDRYGNLPEGVAYVPYASAIRLANQFAKEINERQ